MWLRDLAKRWARWRLTAATKSPASIAVSTASIRRFCRWAENRKVALTGPAAITRTRAKKPLRVRRRPSGAV